MMNNILETICNYTLLFFAFSFAGWCMEVVLKYFEYHHFINRGFLIGPYCPIYGCGAVSITLSVSEISSFESSYGITFLISFIVCGFIEYFASLYMEKKFHARWWDYSQKPMNLNGRIWIGNLILFGIGGTAIIKLINPVLFGLFNQMALSTKEVLGVLLIIIFITDYVVSHFVMKLVKSSVENSEADNTEAISSEIRMLLSNRSVLYRRFAEAYPEVIYKTEKISKKLDDIKEETERLRKEAERKIDKINARIDVEKENLVLSLEPSGIIKNSIIEKQDKLIEMLEHREDNENDIMELKNEIIELKNEIDNKRKIMRSKQN